MNTLREAIDTIGGVKAAAIAINKSERAVYKWLCNGALPRSEYTGETNYSEILARISAGAFTAKQLRDVARPLPKVA